MEHIVHEMDIDLVPIDDLAVRPIYPPFPSLLFPLCSPDHLLAASRSTIVWPPIATVRMRLLFLKDADVDERIAVDHHKVRELAGLEAPDPIVHFQELPSMVVTESASSRISPISTR